jgi:hypothetical protein
MFRIIWKKFHSGTFLSILTQPFNVIEVLNYPVAIFGGDWGWSENGGNGLGGGVASWG